MVMFGRRVPPKEEPMPEPTPESDAEKALRATVPDMARSRVSTWMRRRGWQIVLPSVLLVAACTLATGWPTAFELMVGLRSPAEITEFPGSIGAWVLAVVGWLGVPAVVGGTVGYFVGGQVARVRALSEQDIVNRVSGIDGGGS